MAHIHYPLVGDPVYGGRLKLPSNCDDLLRHSLQNFKRQALHARKLGLEHPGTGQWLEWQVAVPDDMQELKQLLSSREL